MAGGRLEPHGALGAGAAEGGRCRRLGRRQHPARTAERAAGAAADGQHVAARRRHAQLVVEGGRAVDLGVPRPGGMADVLERRHGQVAVGVLGAAKDGQHVARVVALVGQDRVEGRRVDRLERCGGGVGDRPAGAAQGRLLAPFAVLLGGAPVDVVAVARVDAAHVDAFDGARLGALEARLALERPGLVVQQQEAAAMARRDRVDLLRVLHRGLEAQHVAEGQGHPLQDPQAGHEAHPCTWAMIRMASAVTNRLASEAGRSHFQAKPISWSMRTRGRVARIHTKITTKT